MSKWGKNIKTKERPPKRYAGRKWSSKKKEKG